MLGVEWGLEGTFYTSDVAQTTTSPVRYSNCFECKSHAISESQYCSHSSSPSLSSHFLSASSSSVFLKSWMADKGVPFRDGHSPSLILSAVTGYLYLCWLLHTAINKLLWERLKSSQVFGYNPWIYKRRFDNMAIWQNDHSVFYPVAHVLPSHGLLTKIIALDMKYTLLEWFSNACWNQLAVPWQSCRYSISGDVLFDRSVLLYVGCTCG